MYIKAVYCHLAYLTSLMAFPGGSDGKASAASAGDMGLISEMGISPGEGNSNSIILAWRIPWTEEPGRLQSRGSQESDMT